MASAAARQTNETPCSTGQLIAPHLVTSLTKAARLVVTILLLSSDIHSSLALSKSQCQLGDLSVMDHHLCCLCNTVPFHSIHQSHVTALPKSTKCHTCPMLHRVADKNGQGNMSQCEKTDLSAQIWQFSSEFSVYKCSKVLGTKTTEISPSE